MAAAAAFGLMVSSGGCVEEEENTFEPTTTKSANATTQGSGGAGPGSGGQGGAATGGAATGGAATGGAGGLGGASPVLLNGCAEDGSDADDMTTGTAVDLPEWETPHQACIRIKTGTAVTWSNTGALPNTFETHPLRGGVVEGNSTTEDATGIISMSTQTGDSATVTFDTAGTFPYYCATHFFPPMFTMQGVIFVED